MVALSQMLIKASTVGTLPVVQQTEMMWTGSLHCGAASNSGQRIGWLPDENTRPVLSIATVLAASEVSFIAVFGGVKVVAVHTSGHHHPRTTVQGDGGATVLNPGKGHWWHRVPVVLGDDQLHDAVLLAVAPHHHDLGVEVGSLVGQF